MGDQGGTMTTSGVVWNAKLPHVVITSISDHCYFDTDYVRLGYKVVHPDGSEEVFSERVLRQGDFVTHLIVMNGGSR